MLRAKKSVIEKEKKKKKKLSRKQRQTEMENVSLYRDTFYFLTVAMSQGIYIKFVYLQLQYPFRKNSLKYSTKLLGAI